MLQGERANLHWMPFCHQMPSLAREGLSYFSRARPFVSTLNEEDNSRYDDTYIRLLLTNVVVFSRMFLALAGWMIV